MTGPVKPRRHHILNVRVLGMRTRVVVGVLLGVLVVFGAGYGLGRDYGGHSRSGPSSTPMRSHIAADYGKKYCDILPTNIGNITVWNGFTTCSWSK